MIDSRFGGKEKQFRIPSIVQRRRRLLDPMGRGGLWELEKEQSEKTKHFSNVENGLLGGVILYNGVCGVIEKWRLGWTGSLGWRITSAWYTVHGYSLQNTAIPLLVLSWLQTGRRQDRAISQGLKAHSEKQFVSDAENNIGCLDLGYRWSLVVQDCIFNCHSSHVVMKYF